MQVQFENGDYKKPEPIDIDRLDSYLQDQKVRRVLVFLAYGEDGKPTKELRRAWRRCNRTQHRR